MPLLSFGDGRTDLGPDPTEGGLQEISIGAMGVDEDGRQIGVPCTICQCLEVEDDEEAKRMFGVVEVAGLMCEWVNKTGDTEVLHNVLDAIESSVSCLNKHISNKCLCHLKARGPNCDKG